MLQVLSQHTNSKGYFVVKTQNLSLVLKISDICTIKKIRLRFGMANSINPHLRLSLFVEGNQVSNYI